MISRSRMLPLICTVFLGSSFPSQAAEPPTGQISRSKAPGENACEQANIFGLKDSIEFTNCLSELRSDCTPNNFSVDSHDLILTGSAAALAASKSFVKYGIRLRAGQRAFSEAIGSGHHLQKLVADKSKGALFYSLRGELTKAAAREAAKEAASATLAVRLALAESVLGVGALVLYTDNRDCAETLEGAYTTMIAENGVCKKRLALSQTMVNFLNMDPADRNRLLGDPRICGFYEDYSRALNKHGLIGRVNALKCDEKSKQPLSFSVHDGTEQVVANATYNSSGELQKLRFGPVGDPSDRTATAFLFAKTKGRNTVQSIVDADSSGRPSMIPLGQLRTAIQSTVIEPEKTANATLDRVGALLRNWNGAKILLRHCCVTPATDVCQRIFKDGELGPARPNKILK